MDFHLSLYDCYDRDVADGTVEVTIPSQLQAAVAVAFENPLPCSQRATTVGAEYVAVAGVDNCDGVVARVLFQ